jgi:hypothetical protein
MMEVRSRRSIYRRLTAYQLTTMQYHKSSSFGKSPSTSWRSLKLPDIVGEVCFSPHLKSRRVFSSIAQDIRSAKSSVFYSLAFVNLLNGDVREEIRECNEDPEILTHGISDLKAGGLQVHLPDWKTAPVSIPLKKVHIDVGMAA